jgi:NAD-dependent SIR2 family protein deacetylase
VLRVDPVEPPDTAPSNASAQELVERLRGRRFAVLTGAGVSTESGIPDYRSPEAAARERRPIHGPDFVRSAALRRRYWARAMAGWERFRLARPGPSHVALARLEEHGLVNGLVTQNVDRLHRNAGSRRVTELHGALAEVVCLDCGVLEDRDAVQARMGAQNPGWPFEPSHIERMAPDGDAELPDSAIEQFVAPSCVQCGGVLKPNVVFFGHNVAKPVVDEAYDVVARAEALLVAGTSLAVFSGYRFLLRASDLKIPIYIVNRGPVRGEERAVLKVEESTGDTLATLARELVRA